MHVFDTSTLLSHGPTQADFNFFPFSLRDCRVLLAYSAYIARLLRLSHDFCRLSHNYRDYCMTIATIAWLSSMWGSQSGIVIGIGTRDHDRDQGLGSELASLLFRSFKIADQHGECSSWKKQNFSKQNLTVKIGFLPFLGYQSLDALHRNKNLWFILTY